MIVVAQGEHVVHVGELRDREEEMASVGDSMNLNIMKRLERCLLVRVEADGGLAKHGSAKGSAIRADKRESRRKVVVEEGYRWAGRGGVIASCEILGSRIHYSSNGRRRGWISCLGRRHVQ